MQASESQAGDTVAGRRGREKSKKRKVSAENTTVLQRYEDYGVVPAKGSAPCLKYFCKYGDLVPMKYKDAAICMVCVKDKVYTELKTVNSSTTGLVHKKAKGPPLGPYSTRVLRS